MIFVKNYFDKDNIEDVSSDDVVDFFSREQVENDTIEFKSFVTVEGDRIADKEKGIIKTISAFLNSEGGLLIWGAPVGQDIEGRTEKVFTGHLTPVTELYEKDQMISKLTNRITPVPYGILFHRIEYQGSNIYLLEAEKSEYAPHQFENKFYMRLDGQTRIAPYHYVEALFKRVKYPNLHGYVTLNEFKLEGSRYLFTITTWIFNLSPHQNDQNVSIRLICNNGMFQGWNNPGMMSRFVFDQGGHEKRIKGIKDVIHYGEPVSHTDVIEFDPHQLQKDQDLTRIILSFGATNSPMKISSYQIQLSTAGSVNLEEAIIEKRENKRAGEGPSNRTMAEKMRTIIGRGPF